MFLEWSKKNLCW
uniref:Uncharacterized protein n=1 Tax=Arundo donax TaxID=35708 RepID=A0A0A9GFM7_ARUDO